MSNIFTWIILILIARSVFSAIAKAAKKLPTSDKDSEAQSLDDRLEEAIRKARAQVKDRKAQRPTPPPVQMPAPDTSARRAAPPPSAPPPREPAAQPAARQQAPPGPQPRRAASPPPMREAPTTMRTPARAAAPAPRAARTAQDALAEARALEARRRAERKEYDDFVHKGHAHKRHDRAGKRGTGAAMARRRGPGARRKRGKTKVGRTLTFPEMMIAEAVMGEPRCRKPHRPHGMPVPSP